MRDQDKWNTIYTEKSHLAPTPSQVLAENLHLLPSTGDALDLACGHGANAILLAKQGLSVSAWDIADQAIKQLASITAERRLAIRATTRDVIDDPPDRNSFHVIVVGRFLDRTIIPRLKEAIRPGGLIYYQTFIHETVHPGGPKNPAYRLRENELLHCFDNWIIRLYREEGRTGRTDQGFRDEAMLIAEKK